MEYLFPKEGIFHRKAEQGLDIGLRNNILNTRNAGFNSKEKES